MLFLAASIEIPLFYGAGLMYGQRSPLIQAEYWRWWVVHLWVEGFFEVFATVVIAFLFTRLKLLSVSSATRAVLFSNQLGGRPQTRKGKGIMPDNDYTTLRTSLRFLKMEWLAMCCIKTNN